MSGGDTIGRGLSLSFLFSLSLSLSLFLAPALSFLSLSRSRSRSLSLRYPEVTLVGEAQQVQCWREREVYQEEEEAACGSLAMCW